jgi:hypothetical protein
MAELESKVAALDSLQQQLDASNAAIEGVLGAQLEKLGDTAKAAVEALPMGVLDKLNWLNANAAIFAPTQEAQPHGTPKPSVGNKQVAQRGATQYRL